MRSSVRGRNADIAYLALLLPLPEGRKVGFPILQVVNLHQVHYRNTHELHGFLHLLNAVLFSIDPHLGCGEKFLFILNLFKQLADHGLGAAVHRRRINDRAAFIEENLQDLPQLRHGSRIIAHIEGAGGPHPDNRKAFACRWNRVGYGLTVFSEYGFRHQRDAGRQQA